jgi:hypothetical protein
MNSVARLAASLAWPSKRERQAEQAARRADFSMTPVVVENKLLPSWRRHLLLPFGKAATKLLASLRSDSAFPRAPQMSTKRIIDLSDFVRDDRRNWRAHELLSPGALQDFQTLTDDAFQSMRRKYFRPADLIAEMRLRKRLRTKLRLKSRRAQDN